MAGVKIIINYEYMNYKNWTTTEAELSFHSLESQCCYIC